VGHPWRSAALAATVVAALAWQGTAAYAADTEMATVTADANLRAEPNTDSEVVAELPAGSTVEVECWATGEPTFGDDMYGSMWLHTTDPGWIHSYLVEPVDVAQCDGGAEPIGDAPGVGGGAVDGGYATVPGAWYNHCEDAIDAGVAPVYFWEPGYDSHLDADHDGIGCEWIPPDE
jgi:hypothetical protein